MARLEELVTGASVDGLMPQESVTIISTSWHGDTVLEVTFKSAEGHLSNTLLYRDDESRLEITRRTRPWSFAADGASFRLVSEAFRIRLAALFDPLLAVHTSMVEPLPHQILAVYEHMITRHPLRFLLADDPGAGKTIMAGLLIKELMARADLERCLIVAPGSLVEQWQDELDQKFHLPFEIATNEAMDASRTGNWFAEHNLAIARLDKLSRDEAVQDRLRASQWDLIVVDEAHKMSATYFGNEAKYTKRYRLGQLLSSATRHFLLMTATPHNGKDEDFQLFLALLDGDRFEGRVRDAAHTIDAGDMMRRLVKEQLLKFDGKPLFPERKAYTVPYPLSDHEAQLYKDVTDYVRDEFNRAEQLDNDGRKGTVGFALTILQRRLASSPEAIFQSLRRRRERLESRAQEARLLARGGKSAFLEAIRTRDAEQALTGLQVLEETDEATAEEIEAAEDEFADQATAARTIEELEIEIEILKHLEASANRLRQSGQDRKWDELSALLQDNPHMFDPAGHRRKLIIFTEHRDTLNYLQNRISTLLGRPEALVVIAGGVGRDQRRAAEEAFRHDPQVQILLATDAAGEGINLQRANLMVNYDLPWNPNRLEQRFGRIHRIGQTEVCHCWNLVAHETREGDVYRRLLEKLENQRQALGGRDSVFDVLGRLFEGQSLRQLLIEAVRYGDQPEVRLRLERAVDNATDQQHLRDLLERETLARDSMDSRRVEQLREDMSRAEARRLQPHFIEAFFMEAFTRLGGRITAREEGRFEITRVPGALRNRDRQIGRAAPILTRYERATFQKDRVRLAGTPIAAFICPGHPLLDAVIDLTLEQHRSCLRQGSILIDPDDASTTPRVLFYLDHTIRDAVRMSDGQQRDISRELQFVEMQKDGSIRVAGSAPYLDYRPATDDERHLLAPLLDEPWLTDGIESKALSHAAQHIVPRHLASVRARRDELIDKSARAVRQRLTREIAHWDHAPIRSTGKGAAFTTAEDIIRLRAAPEAVNHFLATYAPPVLDPFAGGGSIPLEAQRLGLRAHASDLNPVPVLINKALIEIPPKFADQPPVHPKVAKKLSGKNSGAGSGSGSGWSGAQGLAEDVRRYGQWMRDQAEKRIGHLYPKVKVTAAMAKDRPDLKPYVGEELTVIAWLWARTVKCPNPGCGCRMPMARSFWLSKKKGKEAYADPVLNKSKGTVRFKVKFDGEPIPETSNRDMARCLFCGNEMKKAQLRQMCRDHGMQEIPLAVVAEGHRGRVYLEATDELLPEVKAPEAPEIDQLITDDKRWFSPPQYGLPTFRDLFTARQLTALVTFSDLVGEARDKVRADAEAAGHPNPQPYADAVATYLATCVDRLAMTGNNLCRWNPVGPKAQHCYGRQALPMIWDFAEVNFFGDATGSIDAAVQCAADPIRHLGVSTHGVATQASAVDRSTYSGEFICTDPPYYDNIGYADLSDLFYVWLRRSLRDVYPQLLSTTTRV